VTRVTFIVESLDSTRNQ